VWYQGEADVLKKKGAEYFNKQKTLIEGWREFWGTDMPFYFVQIAPWSAYEVGELPLLWHSQSKSLTIPLTGMAVITDLIDNIKDYKKNIVYSGPLLEKITLEGKKARVHFAHAKGLKSSDNKPINEFKIAGIDGKFVDAIAKIEGETIVLSAKGITPLSVQFGWHKVTNPNLVNGENLRASPFQSQITE
jgi:sialate O-acetylesterase